MFHSGSEWHLRVENYGTAEKLRLFHKVMVFLDRDWPFAWAYQKQPTPYKLKTCTKCGGRVYMNPHGKMLEKIAKVAKHLKVGVKVAWFKQLNECFPPGTTPVYNVEMP